MKHEINNPFLKLALLLWPLLLLSAQSGHDRELLSQSRAQQAVGKTIQNTVEDLEALIADLESNGLIQDAMAEKMYAARQVLNQINSRNIPEAVARLRAAAIGSLGRLDNLEVATKEIDVILGELKKTAKDVGNEQKRAAFEQILTQLFTDAEILEEQTMKWGEEQLLAPDLAEVNKQEAMEKQSEIEAQLDALKDMLENEIPNQNDQVVKEELEDVLNSLEGFDLEEMADRQPAEMNEEMPGFHPLPEPENPLGQEALANLPNPESQDLATPQRAENPSQQPQAPNAQDPKSENPMNQENDPKASSAENSAPQKESKREQPQDQTETVASSDDPTPSGERESPGDSAPSPMENGKDQAGAKEEIAKNEEGDAREAGKEEMNRGGAESVLKKSAEALSANDPGAALEAQKDFQELLRQALEAMGSAVAQGTPEPLGPTNLDQPSASNSPFGEPAMNDPTLFEEMTFGETSSGGEIGDEDLEALLSGENPAESASGGGNEGEGEALGAETSESVAAQTSQAGKPSGGQNNDQGKPNGDQENDPNQQGQQTAQSSPGNAKPSSGSSSSSNPFGPPVMMPGGGPSGQGSGSSTASFDKPHGTHYETTQIKGGGGPVSGNYLKTNQSKRNLAEVARQAIRQDYQRRLPAEYRIMTAEYFELLGSLEE
ncbi:MAG: hypothetical protein VXY50_05370 [Verrucomicrobiota bacterium]|nr:hypothetical protein [Verrucomicrobiota bacterium]